jgi:hypothetical protein
MMVKDDFLTACSLSASLLLLHGIPYSIPNFTTRRHHTDSRFEDYET